jgi:myosin-crossreactive antigen
MVDTENNGGDHQLGEDIHKIEETHILGKSSDGIEHTITGFRVAHRVGGKVAQQTPNHLFVIVAMEIKNKSGESFSITRDAYMIRDAERRAYEPDTQADIFLEQDDRIGLEAMEFDHIDPDASKERALIFDVPRGNQISLFIKSTEFPNADTSRVIPLGTIKA